MYSVRSAYHALLAANDSEVALVGSETSHSTRRNDEKWRRLWKLDVLPRVRVFWWRVLKGILPNYATLTRRHVRNHGTYLVCKSTSKTLHHALIECGHAKLFRLLLKISCI
jgi:hypothetical protein